MNALPYPHLSPDLRRLTGDALLLWGDADARRQALLDLLAAWDGRVPLALERAVGRIDGAVVAGLAALGLPRSKSATVEVGMYARPWVGRVTERGVILLDIDRMRRLIVDLRQPDRAFHTWLHESLHARRPSAPDRYAESAPWGGYEEGLVEGLARTATTEQAGMSVVGPAYEQPVQAYRTLAEVAGFDVEPLWRRLWPQPPGEVRRHFGATVNAARRERALPALPPATLARLLGVADRVFASDRLAAQPNPAALTRTWETVFR